MAERAQVEELFTATLAKNGFADRTITAIPPVAMDEQEQGWSGAEILGFKYLCSGIWLWPPGPTAITGQRILMTIQWALTGTWPARAFAVSQGRWRQLLAAHERRVLLA
jgi:hypothetical protein